MSLNLANVELLVFDLWQMFELEDDSDLEELITPVTETLIAVSRLLGVGPSQVFDPLDKQVFIFLQEKELPEHDVGLVEALALQSLAEDVSDPRQVRHCLLPHGLGHKVPVFLRGGGHCGGLML